MGSTGFFEPKNLTESKSEEVRNPSYWNEWEEEFLSNKEHLIVEDEWIKDDVPEAFKEKNLSDSYIEEIRSSAEENLKDIGFVNVDLRFSNYKGADMTGFDVIQSDLHGAILENTTLDCAYIEGSNLTWANLNGASLCYAILRNCDLRWCDLRNTKLTYCEIVECKLAGALFNSETLLPFDKTTAIRKGMVYSTSII